MYKIKVLKEKCNDNRHLTGKFRLKSNIFGKVVIQVQCENFGALCDGRNYTWKNAKSYEIQIIKE